MSRSVCIVVIYACIVDFQQVYEENAWTLINKCKIYIWDGSCVLKFVEYYLHFVDCIGNELFEGFLFTIVFVLERGTIQLDSNLFGCKD